jgi:hypothetical protein
MRSDVMNIDDINSKKKKLAMMIKSSTSPYPPQDPRISEDFFRNQLIMSVPKPIFKYTYDFDENGALYYLGTKGKRHQYRNPHEINMVKAFASSISKGQVSDFVGRNLVNLRTENEENSFFGVDLGKNRTLVPTAYSLRNTYTPGNFVTLPQAATVKVGGEDKTFPAGTEYGAIVQAQLTADGSKIVAYKNGTTDGYDGWYNPTAAKAYLDKAVEALAKEDVIIDEKHPIQIDLPTFTGSEIYEARGNAIKKSIEASLGGFVKVNIIACKTSDDWYNAGYYTESGKEANYDIYDVSGWGPDYGDPSTYLDTMYADAKGAGYMVKCIGIY